MLPNNVKIALDTLKASKLRSFLTMLGIIIGVMSVVLIISLGEGYKNQINNQIDEFGADLITITSSKVVDRNEQGDIENVNLFSVGGGLPFTLEQFEEIKEIDGIKHAGALMVVDGDSTIKANGGELEGAYVTAVTPGLFEATNQEIKAGQFFSNPDAKNVVISESVARELFDQDAPLTETITVKGVDLAVIGVVKNLELSSPVADVSNLIFIPTGVVDDIAKTGVLIEEIDIKVADVDKIDETADRVTAKIKSLRNDQDDFSVIKSDETSQIINQTLGLATTFISAVAGISLLVGGIGIMNIMLAIVSERTYEIGIRKSIGAPNSSILAQFLVEAIVLSVLGAVLGIALAVVIGAIITTTTDLSFGFSVPISIVAIIVSVIVGVIFGLAPAIKASRKDPIAALRRQ